MVGDSTKVKATLQALEGSALHPDSSSPIPSPAVDSQHFRGLSVVSGSWPGGRILLHGAFPLRDKCWGSDGALEAKM